MVDNIFDFFYGFRHNRMRLKCDAREKEQRALASGENVRMHSLLRLRPMMEFAWYLFLGIKFQFHFRETWKIAN